MNYSDRVAVVTGAAGGIGRGLALEAGRRGMRVAIIDVDEKKLAETLHTLREMKVVATAHVANVADPEAVEATAEAIYEAHEDVHLLFNNAGVHLDGVSWQYSDKQWTWLIDINLKGVVNGVRAFLPRMIRRGQEGIIANTASLAGLISFPYSGCYCASKHAVVGFTESVHFELAAAESRIRMALICPGAVATGIATPPPAVRPVSVVAPEARDSGAAEFHSSLVDVINNGMSAENHARLVFEELSKGKFWIISDESYLPMIEERLRSIKERRAPVFGTSIYAEANSQFKIPHGPLSAFKWVDLPEFGGREAIIYRSPDGKRVAAAFEESGKATFTYPFDEFLVVTAGTAKIKVHGGETLELKKGDVAYLREGTSVDFEFSKDFADITCLMADHEVKWR